MRTINNAIYNILSASTGLDTSLYETEIDKPSCSSEKFKFPLNTQADIYEFNKEITIDKEYKNYLIKTYCTIGGTEGNEDGKIIAKKLLKILFTKYVLTLFSWTGVSRTAGLEKKEAFQACEGILTFFHEVIQLADCRWSKQKNEIFFKNHILKHAKQMNEAYEKKKNK